MNANLFRTTVIASPRRSVCVRSNGPSGPLSTQLLFNSEPKHK